MEEMSSRPGVIDFSNRVVRELLRTPKFKAQFKAMLNSLDPPAAAELVRTLMWEDTELFLDLIGVLPELLNTLFIGGRELAEQLDKFPDPMLAAFFARVLGKIDGEALGRMMVALVDAYRRIRRVDGDPLGINSDLGRKYKPVSAGAARKYCFPSWFPPEGQHQETCRGGRRCRIGLRQAVRGLSGSPGRGDPGEPRFCGTCLASFPGGLSHGKWEVSSRWR